jgi:hypothetical protein
VLGLSLELPGIDIGGFTFGANKQTKPLPLPAAWRARVPALFVDYFWFPFSAPHEALWAWENEITAQSSPRPFVAIWPRGRGKSTTAEAAVADMAIRGARRYCLYVCSTQDQADKHTQTIARMLESDAVAQYAPNIGRPKVSQNGNRIWNRKMVTTATGFTVEAIGLDKAVRGQKIDWARPDLIVFDDIDEKHDSETTTTKKEDTVTTSIIPAGATNCAVLFTQNLIHANSIARRLSRSPNKAEAATYLMRRQVSGPFVAVDGLQYMQVQDGDLWRWAITAGQSPWAGFDLAICEDEINRVGPNAFELESQHNVDGDREGALLTQADFDRTRKTAEQVPDLVRIAIGVDPPGGVTECGIVCVGKAKIGTDWHGFTIDDASSPKGARSEDWALDILKCYHRNKADIIFVETNYGGDMATGNIRQTKWTGDDGKVIVDGSKVKIEAVHATRGKVVRAEPVATAFQQGRGHHVGSLDLLEREWRQYVQGDKDSPNRLDAEVWAYTGLELIGEQSQVHVNADGLKKLTGSLNRTGNQDNRRRGREPQRGGIYGSTRR